LHKEEGLRIVAYTIIGIEFNALIIFEKLAGLSQIATLLSITTADDVVRKSGEIIEFRARVREVSGLIGTEINLLVLSGNQADFRSYCGSVDHSGCALQ
jgi:hypothetical protein